MLRRGYVGVCLVEREQRIRQAACSVKKLLSQRDAVSGQAWLVGLALTCVQWLDSC